MINLRKLAETHLNLTVEGAFALPVILISPDGEIIDIDNYGNKLSGQIIYESVMVDVNTGGEVVDNTPQVILRISSLPQVPQEGEKWAVQIPIIPDPDADKETFLMNSAQPPEKFRSLGVVKIYLEKVAQKV